MVSSGTGGSAFTRSTGARKKGIKYLQPDGLDNPRRFKVAPLVQDENDRTLEEMEKVVFIYPESPFVM
jgi:hypothetical protein